MSSKYTQGAGAGRDNVSLLERAVFIYTVIWTYQGKL